MLQLITKWRLNLLLMLFVTSGFYAFSQEDTTTSVGISKTVAEIVKELDYEGKYWAEGSVINLTRGIHQYRQYEFLRNVATTQELVLLTDIPSPVIQAYAFHALVERNNPIVFDILLKHLNDYGMLEIGLWEYNTTVGSRMIYVGDFFYYQLHPPLCMNKKGEYITELIDGENKLEGYSLSEAQQKFVQIQLLSDDSNKLEARSDVLCGMEPDPNYYDKMKELYLNDSIQEALIGLAKFQKKEDLHLIEELLLSSNRKDNYIGIRALGNFPSHDLFPLFKTIVTSVIENNEKDVEMIDHMYLTNTQFKSEESRDLFIYALKNIKMEGKSVHMLAIRFALWWYDGPKHPFLLDSAKTKKHHLKSLKEDYGLYKTAIFRL